MTLSFARGITYMVIKEIMTMDLNSLSSLVTSASSSRKPSAHELSEQITQARKSSYNDTGLATNFICLNLKVIVRLKMAAYKSSSSFVGALRANIAKKGYNAYHPVYMIFNVHVHTESFQILHFFSVYDCRYATLINGPLNPI